mmetsp:Transcript_5338/g.13000  ORF Transcript_5338/g.13000 Transcript_5338/m.13000 type:complete len:259 (-) Transcript_5338:244-1020(-)
MAAVREVQTGEECLKACKIASEALPSKIRGPCLSAQSWAWIEGEKLVRSKPLWSRFGVAVEDNSVVGVVILQLSEDNKELVSCCEVCCWAGCCGAASVCCSTEPDKEVGIKLQSTDVCVDLLAVHPSLHRQGIGTKLLQWADHQALRLLMEFFPEDLKKQGSRMVVHVGASNAAAASFLEGQGYMEVAGGGAGGEPEPSSCLAGAVRCCAPRPEPLVAMTKRLSAPYQRAVQSPGVFKGRRTVVNLPEPPESPEMSRV